MCLCVFLSVDLFIYFKKVYRNHWIWWKIGIGRANFWKLIWLIRTISIEQTLTIMIQANLLNHYLIANHLDILGKTGKNTYLPFYKRQSYSGVFLSQFFSVKELKFYCDFTLDYSRMSNWFPVTIFFDFVFLFRQRFFFCQLYLFHCCFHYHSFFSTIVFNAQ